MLVGIEPKYMFRASQDESACQLSNIFWDSSSNWAFVHFNSLND